MSAVLYHTPFNCSLAVRMAAAEADVPLTLDLVDFETKQLASGGSFLDINPLGQVSVLRLGKGEILTETSACLMWVQSQSQGRFRIHEGEAEYFQLLRWIGFTATELHKQILRVVFYDEATEPVKHSFRTLAPDRFKLLNTHLNGHPYLVGDRCSAADAYLFWFLLLAERAGVPFSEYPHVKSYAARMMDRPKIAQVVESERKLSAKA